MFLPEFVMYNSVAVKNIFLYTFLIKHFFTTLKNIVLYTFFIKQLFPTEITTWVLTQRHFFCGFIWVWQQCWTHAGTIGNGASVAELRLASLCIQGEASELQDDLQFRIVWKIGLGKVSRKKVVKTCVTVPLTLILLGEVKLTLLNCTSNSGRNSYL